MSGGYFRLHRGIFECWEWKALSHEGRCIMITMLSMANWMDKTAYNSTTGQHYTVPRGSFIATQDEVAIEAETSRNSVRAALRILLSAPKGELPFLRREVTEGKTLYTIVKYSEYQDDAKESTRQTPPKHQTLEHALAHGVEHALAHGVEQLLYNDKEISNKENNTPRARAIPGSTDPAPPHLHPDAGPLADECRACLIAKDPRHSLASEISWDNTRGEWMKALSPLLARFSRAEIFAVWQWAVWDTFEAKNMAAGITRMVARFDELRAGMDRVSARAGPGEKPRRKELTPEQREKIARVTK
jgi:hypothetical protein